MRAEADCRTSIGRILNLRDESLVRETIRRGNGVADSEARCTLDYAIEKGRGSVWLSLSEAQYQKLKRR